MNASFLVIVGYFLDGYDFDLTILFFRILTASRLLNLKHIAICGFREVDGICQFIMRGENCQLRMCYLCGFDKIIIPKVRSRNQGYGEQFFKNENIFNLKMRIGSKNIKPFTTQL